MLNLNTVLLESMIWSVLWIVVVIISVRVFPFTIEHDYPHDVRAVAAIPKPTQKQRILGFAFGAAGFITIFGALILFAVLEYMGQVFTFWTIFIHLFIVCMTWNVVDLVIVDWLFICTLSLKCFLLPGTENCPGNRNFIFHFLGFLKGLATMTVIALVFSAISFLILKLFISPASAQQVNQAVQSSWF